MLVRHKKMAAPRNLTQSRDSVGMRRQPRTRLETQKRGCRRMPGSPAFASRIAPRCDNSSGMMPAKRTMLDEAALMEYAARLLSGRAHTSGEMRDKLRRRAARAGDVDTVLANLRRLGYLDDRRFADNFASTRLENEGLGRSRVLRDLRQRHIAPKLAEDAVARTYKEQDEAALIEAFLARKYRGRNLAALFSEEKHLASAWRRLRYAGFSSASSLRVLKRYAADVARLDALESEPEGGAEGDL
jgi:regulatory protein